MASYNSTPHIRLTTVKDQASNGNLVQTMQVDLSHGANFEVALGFGTNQADAVNAAQATLNTRVSQIAKSYNNGWENYDAGLVAPPPQLNGVTGSQWKQSGG